MEKYVPTGKLSKKARRELNRARRGGWGALSPVTRRPPNPKAYNRKKARREEKSDAAPFFYWSLSYLSILLKAATSSKFTVSNFPL